MPQAGATRRSALRVALLLLLAAPAASDVPADGSASQELQATPSPRARPLLLQRLRANGTGDAATAPSGGASAGGAPPAALAPAQRVPTALVATRTSAPPSAWQPADLVSSLDEDVEQPGAPNTDEEPRSEHSVPSRRLKKKHKPQPKLNLYERTNPQWDPKNADPWRGYNLGALDANPPYAWMDMDPVVVIEKERHADFNQLVSNAVRYFNLTISLPYRKYESKRALCYLDIWSLLFEGFQAQEAKLSENAIDIQNMRVVLKMNFDAAMRVTSLAPCMGTSGWVRVVVVGSASMVFPNDSGQKARCEFRNFKVSIIDADARIYPAWVIRSAAKSLGIIPEVSKHAFEHVCQCFRDPIYPRFSQKGYVGVNLEAGAHPDGPPDVVRMGLAVAGMLVLNCSMCYCVWRAGACMRDRKWERERAAGHWTTVSGQSQLRPAMSLDQMGKQPTSQGSSPGMELMRMRQGTQQSFDMGPQSSFASYRVGDSVATVRLSPRNSANPPAENQIWQPSWGSVTMAHQATMPARMTPQPSMPPAHGQMTHHASMALGHSGSITAPAAPGMWGAGPFSRLRSFQR